MSDEFATVVLKELRDFRTETNKRFDNLEEKVDVLQKLSDKHTEAINGLKKETKEHTRAIGELQETTEKMKEEISENTNEIYELKYEREKKTLVDVLEAIKLNSERVKLCNMRIARLEEWKDNLENGLISMV
jgi:hypothetical protein